MQRELRYDNRVNEGAEKECVSINKSKLANGRRKMSTEWERTSQQGTDKNISGVKGYRSVVRKEALVSKVKGQWRNGRASRRRNMGQKGKRKFDKRRRYILEVGEIIGSI